MFYVYEIHASALVLWDVIGSGIDAVFVLMIYDNIYTYVFL